MNVAELLLAALTLPCALSCLYLLAMVFLSAALPQPPVSTRKLRFDIVVPAHNEEAVIERTVASLRRLDWPQDRFRILVVADNCDDRTAELSRRAGAQVLERRDATRRGKGYALEYAFDFSRKEDWADAVAVIDADTEVSRNLLEAFAARIDRGAAAVQAHYGVLNPTASWRTRLMTIAKASFHIVRSRARERLGLSCGIRGTGWCVTHRLLRDVPYACFSLTEDVEFGIALGLAGQRVQYADEAHADAEMATTEPVARKQRQRWEGGRLQLLRSRAWTLLQTALRRRSAVCLDLALDLLVPPLSSLASGTAALTVSALLLALRHPPALPWLWLELACAASLLLYVLRGWQLSGLGRRGLLDLLCAPAFVLWKLLRVSPRRQQVWVSTRRERP